MNTSKKRVIVIALASLFCGLPLLGQEADPWVGTWTSESYRAIDPSTIVRDYEGTVIDEQYTDYKMLIRITNNGGQYNVRVKTIKVSDPSSANYYSPHKVQKVEGNTMWLVRHEDPSPFYVNDKLDSYVGSDHYVKLTLSNGVMRYHHYKFVLLEYDLSKRLVDSSEIMINSKQVNDILDLFNDDW